MNLTPSTDNQPYFNFFRKGLGDPTQGEFVSADMAWYADQMDQDGVPMDVIHLVLAGFWSALVALALLLAPRFQRGGARVCYPSLFYFSGLGAGFIMLELVLMQHLRVLIGSPLYTYSAVLCSLLVGAGLGSRGSLLLGISPTRRWFWPFAAIIGYGTLLLIWPVCWPALLALSAPTRALVAALVLLPLGFFLGMPFPLGILASSPQTLAWAWSANGIFTVVGGLASVVCSLWLGFQLTTVLALLLYAFCMVLFPRLRDHG